jgi:hypothetical protein
MLLEATAAVAVVVTVPGLISVVINHGSEGVFTIHSQQDRYYMSRRR